MIERKPVPSRAKPDLCKRKVQARRLKAQGLSFRSVAEQIGVDESTVRYYLRA